MNETVNFKKQRELGSILTDVFKFIRLTWKTLFGMILKVAGPALLIMLGAYVFYMQSIKSSFGMLESVGAISSFSTNMVLAFIVLILAGVVYYALLNGVVLHAIKSYIKNNGTIVKEEVSTGVRKDFRKLIGTSILVGLIVGAGAMFCVIPGIYFGVALSVAYAVVVFEEREVTDAISYCFNLIKGEWWITFATFLVIFMLYYFIMIIFQVPQYIYFFINTLTVSQEVSADPSSMFDWVYISLTTIGMVFQYLLYAIIAISTAFVYFNLNERKNFTGTMETIDTIGKQEE